MALRAVSVARLLTPLAVLVPIVAAPLGAVWLAPRSQVLALVVLVAGLIAVAASGHFTYGVRTTVENYGDARGLETADGAAVFRAGAAVQLLQLAGEAEPLLSAFRRLGTVSVLNLPTDDPAASALRSLGAKVVVRQHEMLLELEQIAGH